MKNIEFTKMTIQNFKGIENLTIDFKKDTVLKGVNGAGKTTVADAIWWVLFGKDSQGRTQFNVRPQDKNGNNIDHIDIEVKLELVCDGVTKVFGRKSSQNWVTQRGASEPVLRGNTNELTVNESVVKTTEFNEELSQVLNEDDFKMLSNPMHFMNNLDDKQRREVLMKLAGNEEEIENELKQNPQYSDLVEEWNSDLNKGKTFASFLKYLKDKSKTDNEKLKSIPNEIHALESTLEEVEDKDNLEALISGYNAEIQKIDANLNKQIEEPEWVKEALSKVNELNLEVDKLKEKDRNAYLEKVNELDKQRNEIASNITEKNIELSNKKNDIRIKENMLSNAQSLRKELLEEYHLVNNKVFEEPDIETHCSTCGQELKDIDPEAIRKHAEEHFNSKKEEDLKNLVAKGKEQANKIKELEKEVEAKKLELLSIEKELERLELSKSRIKEVEKVENENIELLENEIEELKNKVKEYRENNVPDNSDLISKKQSYMAMIGDVQRKIGKLEQQETTRKKINELLEVEEALRMQKIRFEVLINDALDFENEKNRTFERNLSTRFNNIEWRLFEQQLNGGYRNVCYPLLNGTPYSDQSTGEKIYTGIDIIKTFQEVYQINAPVIIDNRESITLDLELESQSISMYVDENEKKLTVL